MGHTHTIIEKIISNHCGQTVIPGDIVDMAVDDGELMHGIGIHVMLLT